MPNKNTIFVNYAIYEASPDNVGGGYDLKFPKHDEWLNGNTRRNTLKLLGLIRRIVILEKPKEPAYQGMISLPSEFGIRLLVFCWVDYLKGRPMARYLLIRTKGLSLKQICFLVIQIINEPLEWLDRKVQFPYNLSSSNIEYKIQREHQLELLDALMTRPHILVNQVLDKNVEEVLKYLFSIIPQFLFPRLTIGHNLRKLPAQTKSSIIIGERLQGKNILNFRNHEAGAVAKIGKILTENLLHVSFDYILHLSWQMFRSSDSRLHALREIKSKVDLDSWREIKRISKATHFIGLKYRNRKLF